MSTTRETLLIRNVAVGGRPGQDVRVGPDTVLAIGPALPRHHGEPVLDGAGGAVIPGLHDHHVHLRAAVAARQSVDVSGAATAAEFDAVVAAAARPERAAGRWLRVTGWPEHAAGALDRYRLDTLAGGVPVRVQHRSGAMWVLNSAARQQIGLDDAGPPGAERDDRGVPTGRLLRMDGWLRGRLAALIGAQHRAGAAVAVHCVTAEQLVVTVAAVEEAGPAGDRIEHAGVVPPGYAARLARLGLAVVTQPGFVGARGDDYRRDVEAAEQDWLYPCARLLRAGVSVAARRTGAGQVLGPAEGYPPARPWGCSWPRRRTCAAPARSRPASRVTCAFCTPRDPRRWPGRRPPW
jgi:predicted amidohydrolase YtcJ